MRKSHKTSFGHEVVENFVKIIKYKSSSIQMGRTEQQELDLAVLLLPVIFDLSLDAL